MKCECCGYEYKKPEYKWDHDVENQTEPFHEYEIPARDCETGFMIELELYKCPRCKTIKGF